MYLRRKKSGLQTISIRYLNFFLSVCSLLSRRLHQNGKAFIAEEQKTNSIHRWVSDDLVGNQTQHHDKFAPYCTVVWKCGCLPKVIQLFFSRKKKMTKQINHRVRAHDELWQQQKRSFAFGEISFCHPYASPLTTNIEEFESLDIVMSLGVNRLAHSGTASIWPVYTNIQSGHWWHAS